MKKIAKSALPPLADIQPSACHVRFAPISDIAPGRPPAKGAKKPPPGWENRRRTSTGASTSIAAILLPVNELSMNYAS
ncbi:MAG: hypothetical protein JWP51_3799 [Bradyrhizobium sp.]|jgi:hypothetical protein|nr:hypothetical protein [Bradyrhizobium sp.]